MRHEAAWLGGLFIFGQVCSAIGSGIEAVQVIHRRHVDVHQHMRRDADAALHEHMRREAEVVNHEFAKRNDVFNAPGGVWPTVVVPAGFTLAGGVMLTAQSTTTATSSIAASGTAAVAIQAQVAKEAVQNATSWEMQAQMSCMTAVMSLKGKSSNPAGLAVCYNVPYLDEQKGVFEAELRMFNICSPSAEFVGVAPSDMLVTLAYTGATIQASPGGSQIPVKRSLVERQMLTTPDGVVPGGISGSMPDGIMMPIEVAVRMYVGQVNKDLMDAGVNITQFRDLLVPQISISATNPASQKSVNTTLSSSEASFNSGVFATQAGNSSDPTTLLGQPVEQIAAAAQGLPTPYDVPGLALGVFPTGLIVTGVWMTLFIGVVGAGTIGRMQFRDQYRRAIRAQKEQGQRRI